MTEIIEHKPTRTRPPNRRLAETFDVRHNGKRFHVSVGRFHDGSVSEIFITGPKSGSDLESVCRNAAIILSIARQHGVPLGQICHALTRNSDSSPSSIIGAVLERLIEYGRA